MLRSHHTASPTPRSSPAPCARPTKTTLLAAVERKSSISAKKSTLASPTAPTASVLIRDTKKVSVTPESAYEKFCKIRGPAGSAILWVIPVSIVERG